MTTQKQLKDFSGAGKLAAEYFSSLKQMQDDFIQSRQDLLSGFSVSDSLNSGFASDSSATLNRSASIDTDTMNAAAQKILDARAARAAKASRQSSGSDLSQDTALAWMNDAQSALKNAQFELRTARGSAEDTASAQQAYDTAKQNYDTARSVYASFAAQGNANEETDSDSSHVTVRPLSDIEDDLNAAGTYVEDLDQWVAKPGQQEILNNLLYEQRLAWKQQAESVNKQYTKGDQITAATAASFGDGLDQFDTNTKISIYKLFGLDVPDYLLVESPLAIKNEKTLEDASGALKTIGELSQIAGNAAPTMVLSMLFPASALGELGTAAKILGKVATSSSVYGSSYGGAYAQARNEGKTDKEATTYGVLSGASEVVLGKVLEGLSKGGSKFLSKKLEGTVIGAIKNNASKAIDEMLGNSQTASAAAAIIKNMGKEAAEEYFQYALDPLMQNVSFDGKDFTAKEMLTNAFSKEAFHSALLGALSSGSSNLTGVAANGVASKLTGEGGLLSEANLNKLTESEAKEINNALTSAYAGMLENEGYRNIDEYRKQAEKTNANKKSAITHALAVGAELAQMIETQTQKAEKAMASKNVAKAITASQNEESANRNGEKTAAASQEQTGKPSIFSEEQLKTMNVPQLKSILQNLAPAFAEKWKSAGLKTAEVDRQVAEMLGGNNSAQLARDIGTMQKELGTGVEVATENETTADGLNGSGDDGKINENNEPNIDETQSDNSNELFSELEKDQFTILKWDDYPDGPKPKGPFRLIDGEEYDNARRAANKVNKSLHRNNPESKGKQYHEIHTVKFGGSPTDLTNKVLLTPEEHMYYTKWWNEIQRKREGKGKGGK